MTRLTTKYSGLIFGAQSIRKIQADMKTNSRRVIKNQPPCDPLHTSVDDPSDTVCVGQHTWWSGNHTQGIYHSAKCPWKVGQIVYVKESVRTELNEHGIDFFYKADSTNPDGWGKGVWKSPLFMPMAAARIWLLITSIRVERLQDITKADAIAEGAPPSHSSIDCVPRTGLS